MTDVQRMVVSAMTMVVAVLASVIEMVVSWWQCGPVVRLNTSDANGLGSIPGPDNMQA